MLVFDGQIIQDSAIDVIPVAFVHKFFCEFSLILVPPVPSIFAKGDGRIKGKIHRTDAIAFTVTLVVLATGGLPEINLANVSCSTQFREILRLIHIRCTDL